MFAFGSIEDPVYINARIVHVFAFLLGSGTFQSRFGQDSARSQRKLGFESGKRENSVLNPGSELPGEALQLETIGLLMELYSLI